MDGHVVTEPIRDELLRGRAKRHCEGILATFDELIARHLAEDRLARRLRDVCHRMTGETWAQLLYAASAEHRQYHVPWDSAPAAVKPLYRALGSAVVAELRRRLEVR
jgi:hypothetical protein